MTVFPPDLATSLAAARAELARMREAIRAGIEELDAGAARIAAWTADQERLGATIDAKQRAVGLIETALERYAAPRDRPDLRLVGAADRYLSAMRDEREEVDEEQGLHVEQDGLCAVHPVPIHPPCDLRYDVLDAAGFPSFVTARSCPR